MAESVVHQFQLSKSFDNFRMNRFQPGRFRLASAARVVLAAILLFAFLSGVVPLASVSAGSMCRLECCAGRTPHAAGSCMDGSCEASLLTHPKAARSNKAKRDHGDQFCGPGHAVVMKSLARMRSNHAPLEVGSDQTTVSAAAFGKPCQPDCGACASGFTNPNRQKNSAAIADAVRPRAPTATDSSDFGAHLNKILKTLCRQCAPRGPPLS
jgi:hypothetical protein